MTQIVNVTAVLPDRILQDAVIAFEDEKIVYVGKERQSAQTTYDAEGAIASAGFIDIHCHGGNGLDFMDSSTDDMKKIAKFHLLHGTTTLIPTTMTDEWSAIERVLDEYKKLYDSGNRLTLEGVHLEGPWLSPLQCGAQPTDTMDLPSVEKLSEILQKYPFIQRISVAPELPNGMEVGKEGQKRGVVMSVAHTDADFKTTVTASQNGYTLLTHFYSGMAGVVRKNAFRVAGAVEAGYYCDDLFVEIIADGRHLPDELLRLIYKIKGADRVCLVTDAMRASGLPDGTQSTLGRLDDGIPVIVEDGVAKLLDRQSFAGSVATTDRLVRTMLAAKVSLVDISKMASATPAKVMGFDDRGSIETGKRADLVLTDTALNIKKVILKGEFIL
jgi:N-acetylglucosamine-6-phosphate deacetylase